MTIGRARAIRGCARSGHPGHGPQYNLTKWAGGKTVTVHLRPGPELDKAEREVAEYERFRDLVEAGCKSVIGQRLRQSGMHWTTDGADAIRLTSPGLPD